jgi:predicted dehydrogenase
MNQDATKTQDGGATRREFIKKSTLAATATAVGVNLFKTPVYGQNQAPSAGVTGANNRLRVAYIGTGNQGQFHISSQKEHADQNNIEQVAVCDLAKTRQKQAADLIGGNVKIFENYEELLAMKDIDAITIATCDHWHCKTALAALDAGKHIYVEKPMTRYLPEAFQLYDKVKSTGKILQVGSQGCTAQAWHKAAELINAPEKDNQVGKVVWAQGYYCRNSKNGEWNLPVPEWAKDPKDLNWDKWQEPVHDKQAQNAEAYIRWRKYYPYCAGLLGDLAPHRLLPLMLATGNPEFPTRVVSLGSKPIHADATPPGNPERDVPEQVEILAEFPSGMTLVIVVSTVNAHSPGFTIYGHKSSLEIGSSGERIKLTPEKEWTDDIDLQTFDGLSPIESVPEHEKNWFDCIRSGKSPNANIDLAIRAQVVISLAEMSNRMNIMCVWDEKERKIKTTDGKEMAAITYGTIEPS